MKLGSDNSNLLGFLNQSVMMIVLDGLNKSSHICRFHFSVLYHSWYLALFAFELLFSSLLSQFCELNLQIAIFDLCDLTQFLIMEQLFFQFVQLLNQSFVIFG